MVLAIAVLAATCAISGNAAEERQTLPKPPDKQMLLLMDTDENGNISKQECLRFMDAEFDRLYPGKTIFLDPRKLAMT